MIRLSYIIPETWPKILSEIFPFFPKKALKFFLEMSKILPKTLKKFSKNFVFFDGDITRKNEL